MPKFAAAKRPAHKPGTGRGAPDSPSATREMPQFASTKRRAPPPVSTPQITRTERRALEHAPAARAAGKQPARITPPPQADTAREQVIADAVRLVQWGRKWYELAELIARMADRPPLPEVRRILKDNKTAIEKKAGGAASAAALEAGLETLGNLLRKTRSKPAMITTKNLSKRYGDILAVDDLTFSVAPGEVLGFLGANGAGKSTTMRMIAGFIAPTAGDVTVCGHDISRPRSPPSPASAICPKALPATGR